MLLFTGLQNSSPWGKSTSRLAMSKTFLYSRYQRMVHLSRLTFSRDMVYKVSMIKSNCWEVRKLRFRLLILGKTIRMNSNILSSKSEKVRAIIVEDEDIAIEGMKHLLEPCHALIEIVGVARNGEEAVQLIDLQKPELVFMDIQIPGLNGLQVLQRVSHKPRVVFTTAFDHHAIEAFELNSVD